MKQRQKAAGIIRDLGMILMIIFSVTQVFPDIALAGMGVWTGLACFFIVEAVHGDTGTASNLRFASMGKELKDRKVIGMILAAAGVQILSVILGCAVFGKAFINYDLGRALDVIHTQSIAKFLAVLPLSGWGEEIAWRGFFLGKKKENIPWGPWAVFSSVLFAAGHISAHPLPLVLYGISFNFICSLILCLLFKRTGNCMISTVGHVIGNFAEVLFILAVF